MRTRAEREREGDAQVPSRMTRRDTPALTRTPVGIYHLGLGPLLLICSASAGTEVVAMQGSDETK